LTEGKKQVTVANETLSCSQNTLKRKELNEIDGRKESKFEAGEYSIIIARTEPHM
jgi:hypothetical protein